MHHDNTSEVKSSQWLCVPYFRYTRSYLKLRHPDNTVIWLGKTCLSHDSSRDFVLTNISINQKTHTLRKNENCIKILRDIRASNWATRRQTGKIKHIRTLTAGGDDGKCNKCDVKEGKVGKSRLNKRVLYVMGYILLCHFIKRSIDVNHRNLTLVLFNMVVNLMLTRH